MKTYHLYYGESLHAEGKLRHVESQKSKVESSSSGKVLMTRRLRNIEKQSEKVFLIFSQRTNYKLQTA